LLDLGNFAVGNVRIDRDLRRRRNGSRSRDARHRGNVGNINVVGNIGDIGNAGNDGVVGNVRLRLKQCCVIVDSNINVAHNAGRRRSNRNSVGFYRDQQSRGQLRRRGPDDERIALCGCSNVGADDAQRFISRDKHRAGSDHRDHRNVDHSRRLMKKFFVCEREQP
jgi:hypothetical protein